MTDPAREALLAEVDRQVEAQQAACAARLRAVLGPSPADLERARIEALERDEQATERTHD